MAGAIPRRLALPTLQVDAPIVPVGLLPSGGLGGPPHPHVLGWWPDGARPATRHGSVVIDGHVDTAADGPGALFHLRELRLGDPLVLSTEQGSQHYVIAALRSYPKAHLSAEVFASSGPPRLVLITCGGAFNHSLRWLKRSGCQSGQATTGGVQQSAWWGPALDALASHCFSHQLLCLVSSDSDFTRLASRCMGSANTSIHKTVRGLLWRCISIHETVRGVVLCAGYACAG
jgi:hypothetical protein